MQDQVEVRIEHINKVYPDGTNALKDINLVVNRGEIVVLLGPSGCGKSTLLRTIGGLEKKTSGNIYFNETEISDTPVEKRNVGFVFQNYALFPTMTVRQNIGFGLKLRHMEKAQLAEKVESLIKMMNLEPYADKKPSQLSGGQQQRVAIARVLAIEPKVLLLDEPLTALDAKLKEHLRIELAQMLRRLGITAIYVTHDQMEAMALADRIAVMHNGVIEQVDTPQGIYSSPASEFVAQFIGQINKLKGVAVEKGGQLMIDAGFTCLPYTGGREIKAGEEVTVFLRPEDMTLSDTEDGVPAVVEQNVFMGGYYHIGARIADQTVYFQAPNTRRFEAGDSIRIRIDNEKLIVI